MTTVQRRRTLPARGARRLACIRYLFSAENSVARVAETRNYIAMLVKVIVKTGAVNRYVRMGGGKRLKTFGSRNYAHKLNSFRIKLFYF